MRPAFEQLGKAARGKVDRASHFLGGWRWAFMPLGLLALLAVGVHAAADTLDDRILWAIGRADAAFDWLAGQASLTSPLVDWIGSAERLAIARALTLVWELAADVILLLPALGYREETEPHTPRGIARAKQRGWRRLIDRVREDPVPLRVVRPLLTFAIALAGACGVGKLVQGALYLGLLPAIGSGAAGFLARVIAIAALVGVSASFGWRAVLRSVQHAHEVAETLRGHPHRVRMLAGLWGSLLVLPLGIAALVDASPLLSFFR